MDSKLQVQWVEKEHQVFALVVGETDFLKSRVDDGSGAKFWGWKLHLSCQQSRSCQGQIKTISNSLTLILCVILLHYFENEDSSHQQSCQLIIYLHKANMTSCMRTTSYVMDLAFMTYRYAEGASHGMYWIAQFGGTETSPDQIDEFRLMNLYIYTHPILRKNYVPRNAKQSSFSKIIIEDSENEAR